MGWTTGGSPSTAGEGQGNILVLGPEQETEASRWREDKAHEVRLHRRMAFWQRTSFILVLVVFVAVLSQGVVEATRMLAEDFASASHLTTYPSIYEKAKSSMVCWLGRLSSGPSPSGPGN
ncbi:hypothetical protein NE237_019373 [Protea cynaroides]|uniref:Uncharacterized protein n=1 Tax=Protea cynaroides TaxID=273540 RepID=A0A9Q0KBS2_9MAGN|nr:hypothetical protein NE237_019373 [Protea cynaroides]